MATEQRQRRRGVRETEVPTRLGERYEVGARLGAGGMAEVRAGEDLRLGRPVAIKLLHAQYAHVPDVRRRFDAEARAAAGLAHPNIVAVFDTGVDDGIPYIVMEQLPGTTLADEIARGPLEPARVRDIGVQILSALSVAHGAGIVHRDVKPSNVLFAPGGAWKVADFGIAKGAEALTDLTAPDALPCTPGYVAPERLEGEAATPASDLYSLGVVLYEALTGQRPFTADSPLAVAHLVRSGHAAPLDAARLGADPSLVEIVERAMDRDPDRRFSSAGEMEAALTSVPTRPAEHRTADAVTLPGSGADPAPTRTAPTGALAAADAAAARKLRLDIWRLAPVVWVAIGIIAVVIVALALASQGGGGSAPTWVPTTAPATPRAPSTAPAARSLPRPLENALKRLQREVRP